MIRFVFTSVLLMAALLASDAPKPNFTGDWKMDPARSDFGQLPRPSEYERKIQHIEPLIQMTVRQVTAMGDQTIDSVLRTDGQEITNKYHTGEAKTVGKWVGRDLEFATRRPVEGGEAVSRERWSLSTDGKTLISVTNMATPRGSFQVKMVLRKQ
jgi:hypothetical protein